MANLNLKYIRDHYFSVSTPHYQVAATNPFYRIYSVGCSLISQTLLLLSCLPLLTIKRLPEPLHQFPVREFYHHQWLDDLQHITPPHNKVAYAAARIVDAYRVASEYGVLSKYLKRKRSCEYGCECECTGDCSRITM